MNKIGLIAVAFVGAVSSSVAFAFGAAAISEKDHAVFVTVTMLRTQKAAEAAALSQCKATEEALGFTGSTSCHVVERFKDATLCEAKNPDMHVTVWSVDENRQRASDFATRKVKPLVPESAPGIPAAGGGCYTDGPDQPGGYHD